VNQLETQLKSEEFERQISACSALIEKYLHLDLDEKVASGFIEDVDDDAEKNRQEEGDHEEQSTEKESAPASETEQETPTEEGEDSGAEATDPLHERMMGLIDLYNEKREGLLNKILGEEKSNFERKKELIQKLRTLIEEEEHIGKAFKEFNQIRDDWNNAGNVPGKQRQELNRDYSNLMELFYYNINIYKQLQDHDLKRNLELKQDVLEQLKELQKQKELRPLEEGVNLCIDRWNDIGPTYREEWDAIKEEFWLLVKETYNTIRDHYKSRKEEQHANLEKKEALVLKAKEIAELDLQNHKKWQEKTDEIIALQEEWKTIGYASREKNEAVWKAFRGVCDQFFQKKREFFKEIRNEQDAHAKKKEELIEKAEKFKESTDWKTATHELIQLQKQWKEVGPAHQRAEQKLWKQFRGICDQFFKRKKEFFATLDDRQADNLKQKEAVIKEVEAYTLTGERIADLEALKEFSNRFNAIDHVPFKDKDRVYKAFTEALDTKYKSMKMDRTEREAIQFKSRIETLKENDNDHVLEREARGMQDKMSKLKAEVIQLENNLGFFANSKGADALKKQVEEKINRAKAEIDGLERKLRMVKKMG
jgi:hypothetical protein